MVVAVPADADARFCSGAVRDGERLADADLCHLRLGVVFQDMLCRIEYEGFLELELRHADEILQILGQLRVVYGMHQIVVLGGEGKIKPYGNVQHYGLLVFPFVGERPENAVELDVF